MATARKAPPPKNHPQANNKMKRVFNFSAGPATLPESVLAQVRDDSHTWDLSAGVADVDTGRPVRPQFRQRGAPGTFVYLVNADNTVTVKPVTLGPASAEQIAIQSGLAPGDGVVIDGADKLRNGARVVPRNAEGSPGGGRGPAGRPAGGTAGRGAGAGNANSEGDTTPGNQAPGSAANGTAAPPPGGPGSGTGGGRRSRGAQ